MESVILILALLFSLLVATLALANQAVVPINYFFGRTEISLIVLILGSASAGAIVVGLFSLFRSLRTALRFREMRRHREELHRQLGTLEQENALLARELERLQEEQQAPPESPEPCAAVPADEVSPAQGRTGEGAADDPER